MKQNINEVQLPQTPEALKSEFGPDLGSMTWASSRQKIEELNSHLVPGNKPWRLPTKDELMDEYGRNSTEFAPINYWSSQQDYTRGSNYTPNYYYYVNMGSGEIGSLDEGGCGARPMRNIS